MRILSNYNSVNAWNLLSGFQECKQHLISIFKHSIDSQEFGLKSSRPLTKACRCITHIIAFFAYALPIVNLVLLLAASKLQARLFPQADILACRQAWETLSSPESACIGLARELEEREIIEIDAEKAENFATLTKINLGKFTLVSFLPICGEHNLPSDVQAVVFLKQANNSFLVQSLATYLARNTIKPDKKPLLASFIHEHVPNPTLLELLIKIPQEPQHIQVDPVYVISYQYRGETLALNIGSHLQNGRQHLINYLAATIPSLKKAKNPQLAAKHLVNKLLQKSPLHEKVRNEFPLAEPLAHSFEVHVDAETGHYTATCHYQTGKRRIIGTIHQEAFSYVINHKQVNN